MCASVCVLASYVCFCALCVWGVVYVCYVRDVCVFVCVFVNAAEGRLL